MTTIGHRIADAILAWGLKSGVKQAGLQRNHVELSFGQISYLSNRAPTGPEAIVMLHGIVANAHSWPSWVKALPRLDCTLIAPDLPGHGDSVASEDLDYGIAAQAQRIHQLLATLGLRRVHLIGNSMGGAIALHLAATAPELIASLVLIGSAGANVSELAPSALSQSIADTGVNPMLDVHTVEQYRAMLAIGLQRPPALPGFIVRALLRDYQRRAALNLKIASDVSNDIDQSAFLPQISAPTLIIWGELDQVIHLDNARWLKQHLRYSQLQIIADAGHITMLDAPPAVARACLDFYAGLPTPITRVSGK